MGQATLLINTAGKKPRPMNMKHRAQGYSTMEMKNTEQLQRAREREIALWVCKWVLNNLLEDRRKLVWRRY